METVTGTCFKTTHFLCAVTGEKNRKPVTQRLEKKQHKKQRDGGRGNLAMRKLWPDSIKKQKLLGEL